MLIMAKHKKFTNILILQLAIIAFSTASVLAKIASSLLFLSFEFILCYSSMMIIMAVYAVVWQKAIKNIDIIVAYAFKSIVVLWVLLWSVLFFNEKILWNNIIGGMLIVTGIVIGADKK